MYTAFKNYIKLTFNFFGFEVKAIKSKIPVEFSNIETKIFNYVIQNKLTMVSEEKLIATILSCKYVLDNNIKGDFVECGVAAGGNSIAAAMMFKEYKSKKKVYLFDTFEGMTIPSEHDFKISDNSLPIKKYNDSIRDGFNQWCYVPLEEVKNNFKKAGVLEKNILFVKGDVTKTLLNKKQLPTSVSVLRLDTDWYESTNSELNYLYPLLSNYGLILIDDYGHWGGQKKAVDKFFTYSEYRRPFFTYSDKAGRLGMKINY